jgi:hypothetical protein
MNLHLSVTAALKLVETVGSCNPSQIFARSALCAPSAELTRSSWIIPLALDA